MGIGACGWAEPAVPHDPGLLEPHGTPTTRPAVSDPDVPSTLWSAGGGCGG
jgi:hypothetical protein